MKKIFGILSLIAILTVAFTSQASANDGIDNEIVYDIGYDTPSIVASVVSVESVVGVFNVADEPVNYTSVEGFSESVNSDASYFAITTSITEPDIRGKEPICYENSITNRNCPIYNSVTDTYSDVEKPVGWSTSNI